MSIFNHISLIILMLFKNRLLRIIYLFLLLCTFIVIILSCSDYFVNFFTIFYQQNTILLFLQQHTWHYITYFSVHYHSSMHHSNSKYHCLLLHQFFSSILSTQKTPESKLCPQAYGSFGNHNIIFLINFLLYICLFYISTCRSLEHSTVTKYEAYNIADLIFLVRLCNIKDNVV